MTEVNHRKQKFLEWSKENLGNKVGQWYAPYLEVFGQLLIKFQLDKGKLYLTNFFEYGSFNEFKVIYQQIIGQNDEEISQILQGKMVRYPENYAKEKLVWNQKYAQMTYERGERSRPDHHGGIADFGAVLRAYLKFLYYTENPLLIYPKRDSEVDDSLNYWLYVPGEKANFLNENIIGIKWDFLGPLNQYASSKDIEKMIADYRQDGKRPTNDAKAVWDFYDKMKIGDIVYAKAGNKLIGRGIVTGDYYFDHEADDYKHRRQIKWTDKGQWDLKEKYTNKMLTCFNDYLDDVSDMNHLIDVEMMNVSDGFKTWLAKQIQPNGEYLNEKTVNQKIASLKDIEKTFDVTIFGETHIETLKNIKEKVLSDNTYQRYQGVSSSAIDYYIRYIESNENIDYTLNDFLSEVFMDDVQARQLQSVLKNKKNLILKGAPGVGKTFIAERLAYLMMQERDDTRIQMIQFHQSYSYEDFIEGYRPKVEGDGFELKQGPFVNFARQAERDPNRDYFFIIDEINRGNMSKIFGELMMLIEKDKRGKAINLLYSNEKFTVPQNMYLIGMMNTADRSLALLDYALRRRFAFVEISPAFDNVNFKKHLGDDPKVIALINEIKRLNASICEELGTGFQIGHSYFMGDVKTYIEEVIEFELIPQLYEYWFDDVDKAQSWATRLQEAYYEN